MKKFLKNSQNKPDLGKSDSLSDKEKDAVLSEFKKIRKEAVVQNLKKLSYIGKKNGLTR